VSLWTKYLRGPEGRWTFRAERLRLRDGRSLVEALERDPWQRCILEILDAPETRLAYIDGTRGIGKTTLCAAVAVERLVLRPDHDVFVLANDRDQAAILAREATGFVQRDAALSRVCRPMAREIRNAANGSLLQVLASDATSNFGFGVRPFTAIFDEFWGQANRDLWDALWTAVPKTHGAQVVVLTNAGPDRNGVAWDVRELCRESTDPALRFWSSAEHGVVPSWIPAAEVERQRRTLPPSVFARLWKGEWGHGGGDFLTREDVETCIEERLDAHGLTFDEDRRHYIGVDLGLKHDRSVVVVAHKERETAVVDHVRTWFGTPERPVSLEDVAAHLTMLARKIPRLRRGFLDPWQGAMLLERMKRSGMRSLEEFTFTPANVQKLSQALWQAFRASTIRIPAHAQLVDELVTARIVERRYGWRVDHQAGGFSDHLMALGLALVAALPDSGQRVTADPSWEMLLDDFRSRVRDWRPFGFGKRVGLRSVTIGGRVPEDVEAGIRVAQILEKLERISPPEIDALRRHYSELATQQGARRTLECVDGGWLDRELGRVGDFINLRADCAKEERCDERTTSTP